MKTRRKRWLTFMGVAVVLGLTFGGGATAHAAVFAEIDLSGDYTDSHDLFEDAFGAGGFTEYYTASNVTRNGVPFWVKTSGINTVSTPTFGPQDIAIALGGMMTNRVHMLAVGTYLSEGFGHAYSWCEDPAHFSFDAHYSDGSVESLFPTDTVTGLNRWADALYSDGAVDEFLFWRGFPSYVHQYYIDTDPTKPIDSIVMRDKFGDYADYTVFAMTAEVIPEPSTFIIWSLLGSLTFTLGWWRRRRAA